MSHEITMAHCNKCGQPTKHDVITAERKEGTYEEHGGQEEDVEHWHEVYEMLKCRGCETVKLRHTQQWSEDTPATTVFYPPAIARREPPWVNHELFELFSNVTVPALTCALMREVYIAVQNDMHRLAAIGIRAAIESVMIEKVGDQGSFKANMDALQKAGYVSVRQRGNLDSILGAGDAAIHRGYDPSCSDINIVLDIAESLIAEVYLHDHRANELDKNVPKRPSRKQNLQ